VGDLQAAAHGLFRLEVGPRSRSEAMIMSVDEGKGFLVAINANWLSNPFIEIIDMRILDHVVPAR